MEVFEPKLVDKIGKCKFCGQYKAIQVPESYDEEEVAKIATSQCNCDDALTEQFINKMIESTEAQIKSLFKDKGLDLFKNTFLKLVEPMARHELERISIKNGKYTITMKRKSGGIEVSIKVVNEEKVES